MHAAGALGYRALALQGEVIACSSCLAESEGDQLSRGLFFRGSAGIQGFSIELSTRMSMEGLGHQGRLLGKVIGGSFLTAGG